MQKLLTALATTVALTAAIFPVNAQETCSKLSSSPPVPNNPHHIRNVVWRNMQSSCKTDASIINSTLQSKNFVFQLQVGAQSLTLLSISAPTTVRLSDLISIKNQAGEAIAATVKVDGQKATIIFAQPIAPGSLLTVVKQVRAPKDVQLFESTLTGKTEGVTSEISLGTVKAQSTIN